MAFCFDGVLVGGGIIYVTAEFVGSDMKKLLIFVFFWLGALQQRPSIMKRSRRRQTPTQPPLNKFDALAAIAASGDGQAASAAVALTQTLQ